MTEKTKLADLELLLEQATDRFKAAEKAESIARSAACDAKNQLNAAQREFDKYVDGMRSQAPSDTDWKRPTRGIISADKLFDSYENNTPHG